MTTSHVFSGEWVFGSARAQLTWAGLDGETLLQAPALQAGLRSAHCMFWDVGSGGGTCPDHDLPKQITGVQDAGPTMQAHFTPLLVSYLPISH